MSSQLTFPASSSSTLVEREHSNEEEDDDEEQEKSDSHLTHSKRYLGFIREIIGFVRSNQASLIPPEDARLLEDFGKDFSEDAQRLLICLWLRKSMKWHPVRRMKKLAGRLELDQERLKAVMSELCEDSRFAESQIQIDDALECLIVPQLQVIMGEPKQRPKRELVTRLKNDPRLYQLVYDTLESCIRIKMDIVRLLRRLILVYYHLNPLPPPLVPGSDDHAIANFEVKEGLWKHFGASRYRMRYEPFTHDYETLVKFELVNFPTPQKLRPTRVDNYLLIFDDVLDSVGTGQELPEPSAAVIAACRALNVAARHVLAGLVLERETIVSYSKLEKMNSDGRFNVVDHYTDVLRVFTERGVLFSDEANLDSLNRVKFKDLKVLAVKHKVSLRGIQVKTGSIKAFQEAFTQMRINSRCSIEDAVMRDVRAKLQEQRKRQLMLKPEAEQALEACITKYFRRHRISPSYIARRPFNDIRKQFITSEPFAIPYSDPIPISRSSQ
ncbi:hypothetical protein R3P38DRAFT_2849531 [Favolaschia claudopus]|uniref:Uncharacterized protein n=1 Tax=Favolaschia claudopus TaxID=2862362 RepID=A0AAW0DT09_9AGAR